MPNIIGYKDLSNLYIKPAAESTRTISDIDLKSASEPERVLNPIVSESYMRQYIEEHGGITPTGNIEITENTAEGEPLNIAQYATATVNVAGGGGGLPYMEATITNDSTTFVMTTEKGMNVILDSDNLGIETALPYAPNATVTKKYLYLAPAFGETDYTCYPLGWVGDGRTINVTMLSNLINCTFDAEGNGFIITDPTQNSSVTINLGTIG